MTERLDRTDADRLLAGAPGTDSTTPEVAALLRAAALPSERAPATALITAMAAEARSSFDLHPDPPRSRPVYAKILTAKVAAVAALVAFTATGAAAATGTLPDAAQDGLSRAAEHVGFDLPRSDDKASEGHDQDDLDETEATEETEAVDAETELDEVETQTGAPDDTHGAEVSDTAHEEYDSGADKGAAVSTVASDGHRAEPDHPVPEDVSTVEETEHAPPADAGADGRARAEDAKASHGDDATTDDAGEDTTD